jgi:hypothetical protein
MKRALICATTLALCAAAPAPTPIDPLLTLRGINAGVQDALQGWPQVMQQFPGMTAIRLNCDSGRDSAGDIARVVSEYTGVGVTVEVEDHSGNRNNVLWYQQMAGMFKGNPLVLLEMPNEPDGNGLVGIQVGLIRAIRGAGFTNPIGIQPAGGFDFSNVGPVLAAVGTTGMFVTPHIYFSGTDPNGAVNYVNADIAQCEALGVVCVIDEFGNAMDGFTMDPQGNAVILAVLAANEGANGGTVRAGAVFWAMDNGNHPDGADSAFLTTDGSALTSIGRDVIQPWLSHDKPQPVVTQAQTKQLTQVQQQTAAVQQQITTQPSPPPPSPPSAPATQAPTMPPEVATELAQDQALIQQTQVEITALLAQIAAMQQQLQAAPMPVQLAVPPPSLPATTSPEGGSDSGDGAE